MVQAALDKPDADDVELAHEVRKLDWGRFIQFGDVKIRIKEGKPTFITVERTTKLD